MDTVAETKLLVGLGNPGARYAQSRHNTGWRVSDVLMQQSVPEALPALWQPDNGELFWLTVGSRSCLLLKPMTCMNNSGLAVVKVIEHFHLTPGEMLVVSDDLDLPEGSLRLRAQGSNGGHRGIGSIIQCLHSADFPRLRVGIGRPEPGSPMSIVDWVLAPWVSADSSGVPEALKQAAQVVTVALNGAFERAAALAAQSGIGGQHQCQ